MDMFTQMHHERQLDFLRENWVKPTTEWVPFPKTVDRIIFAGDWHGNSRWLNKIRHRITDYNPDALVHVGDIGVWWGTFMNDVDSLGLPVVVILGNHENYQMVEHLPVDSSGCYRLGRNIIIVPRGFIWEWGGVRFMGVGGAISVDANFRRLNHDYFVEEEITDHDVTRIANVFRDNGEPPVDIVVAHDAPQWANIPTIDDQPAPRWIPRELYQKTVDNRKKLSDIILASGAKMLYHGHYHVYYAKTVRTPVDTVMSMNGLHMDGNASNLEETTMRELADRIARLEAMG